LKSDEAEAIHHLKLLYEREQKFKIENLDVTKISNREDILKIKTYQETL